MTGYLLDTNVVSEPVRSQPDPNVLDWLRQLPNDRQFISVLTLAEIMRGIEGLTASKRQLRLGSWARNELPAFFAGRILPIDAGVAETWAKLFKKRHNHMAAFDGLIAATATHHGLTVATRNIRDFDAPGLEIISPWDFTE